MPGNPSGRELAGGPTRDSEWAVLGHFRGPYGPGRHPREPRQGAAASPAARCYCCCCRCVRRGWRGGSCASGACEHGWHCRCRCRCRPRGASGLAVLARLVGGAGPQRASGASRTATMVLSVVGHRGLRVNGGGAKAALGRCCRPRASYSLCLRRDYVTAAGASSPCRLADRLHTVQQQVVKGIVVAVTRV